MNRSTITFICILAPVSSFAVFPEPGVDSQDTTFKYESYVGVDVGPDLVLTAKHLGFQDGKTFGLPGFDASPYGTYTVTNVVNDPNSDLSILTVDHTLPGYYQINTTNVVASQSEISMVGWGATGYANSADNGYVTNTNAPSQRRVSQNNVDFDTSIQLETGQPSFMALISEFKSMGEATLGIGDSGGGWFIDNGGVEQLVGINSFIATFGNGVNYDLPQYNSSGTMTGYFASGAVELRDDQTFLEQNGVMTVPEPSPLLAVGFGCLGVGLLRRRSTRRG